MSVGASGAQPGDQMGWLERACERACEIALVLMVVIIAAESLARGLGGIALEASDELGGYLLVAITFLSLPVCQARHVFHHLELVQSRVSARTRAVSAVVFDLLALVFSVIVLWQLGRLVFISWNFHEVSQTDWATPLWIPMATMPLGMAVLSIRLVRTLTSDLRKIGTAARAR